MLVASFNLHITQQQPLNTGQSAHSEMQLLDRARPLSGASTLSLISDEVVKDYILVVQPSDVKKMERDDGGENSWTDFHALLRQKSVN